jgi:hypothetical protein
MGQPLAPKRGLNGTAACAQAGYKWESRLTIAALEIGNHTIAALEIGKQAFAARQVT